MEPKRLNIRPLEDFQCGTTEKRSLELESLLGSLGGRPGPGEMSSKVQGPDLARKEHTGA